MFSVRVIRSYFLSGVFIGLCWFVIKHSLLISTHKQLFSPRIDNGPEFTLPLASEAKANFSKPLPSPSLSDSDVSRTQRADQQSRQLSSADVRFDDRKTSAETRSTTDVEVVQSKKSKQITSPPTNSTQKTKTNNADEFSVLFSSKCHVDRLGPPAHVAKQCSIHQSRITANETVTVPSLEACSRLTCYKMLADPAAAEDFSRIAEKFLSAYPVRIPTDGELASISGERCAYWRDNYDFNELPPTSAEEVDFPLAFNILAHRSAHQLARLLRAIYRGHNVYCVHIDAKSSAEFQSAVKSMVSCFDNVQLASRLERVVYAGYSRLQADINCMKDHLRSSKPWRYLINTAAQAFPLRTNAELVKILRLYNGSNDIEGIYGGRVLRSRFENEWIEDEKTGLKKTERKNPAPPHDIDIVRGSAYGVFSRNFVKFIIEDQRAQDLLKWSRRTWSPDEFYWSTLHHTYSNPHLRTPGGFSGYPSKKEWLAVYANWGETRCHGHFVHGVCIFGVGDLPALIRRRELFVNKFHIDYQPLALDCLEAWLRHKEECPPVFDYSFYSNLAFIPKRL